MSDQINEVLENDTIPQPEEVAAEVTAEAEAVAETVEPEAKPAADEVSAAEVPDSKWNHGIWNVLYYVPFCVFMCMMSVLAYMAFDMYNSERASLISTLPVGEDGQLVDDEAEDYVPPTVQQDENVKMADVKLPEVAPELPEVSSSPVSSQQSSVSNTVSIDVTPEDADPDMIDPTMAPVMEDGAIVEGAEEEVEGGAAPDVVDELLQ